MVIHHVIQNHTAVDPIYKSCVWYSRYTIIIIDTHIRILMKANLESLTYFNWTHVGTAPETHRVLEPAWDNAIAGKLWLRTKIGRQVSSLQAQLDWSNHLLSIQWKFIVLKSSQSSTEDFSLYKSVMQVEFQTSASNVNLRSNFLLSCRIVGVCFACNLGSWKYHIPRIHVSSPTVKTSSSSKELRLFPSTSAGAIPSQHFTG